MSPELRSPSAVTKTVDPRRTEPSGLAFSMREDITRLSLLLPPLLACASLLVLPGPGVLPSHGGSGEDVLKRDPPTVGPLYAIRCRSDFRSRTAAARSRAAAARSRTAARARVAAAGGGDTCVFELAASCATPAETATALGALLANDDPAPMFVHGPFRPHSSRQSMLSTAPSKATGVATWEKIGSRLKETQPPSLTRSLSLSDEFRACLRRATYQSPRACSRSGLPREPCSSC